jgi:two-component system phosphate regulon sensor histidine kinase PhoR
MNENSKSNPVPRWRVRLFDGRWTLLAVAAVMIYFAVVGSLSVSHIVVASLLILAVTLVVARRENKFRAIATDTGDLAEFREKYTNRFADTLTDPCIIVDSRVVVTHCNNVALQQFPGVARGKPLAFSLRNPELAAAIEEVRRTGDPSATEIHQTVPNETWHEIVVTPLELNDRAPRTANAERFVLVMRNVTEQKRVEAMRADFVANASHELRTPLTSLIGFIDTLQGPAAEDEEARERFLTIMRSQAERMAVLIDDLLSLSRIELRQHLKPTTSVDLKLILSEVTEGLQTQAADAGLDVRVTVPDEDVVISGDRTELYETFENLIDNAIKYGADGKTVEVTLAPVDNRPNFAYVVNVVDHGAGIGAEHVPRLSERFYRVDAESSRKKKGTGLGLAIVKHILNRHGGQMTIRSKLDAGTNVEVLLPA